MTRLPYVAVPYWEIVPSDDDIIGGGFGGFGSGFNFGYHFGFNDEPNENEGPTDKRDMEYEDWANDQADNWCVETCINLDFQTGNDGNAYSGELDR